MTLQPFVGHWPPFSFFIFYTVSRTPWTGISPSLGRYLHTLDSTQTSIPQMEFELTTQTFERAKTVHALDSAATVIGP
jgi:hypothetical protein